MNDKAHSLRSRKEDYSLCCEIATDGRNYKNIPCKVYLPERKSHKPYIIVEILGKETVSHGYDGSFNAERVTEDSKKQLSITSPLVYFAFSSIQGFGYEDQIQTIVIEPQDLLITRWINRVEDDSASSSCLMTFWISPNDNITPFMSLYESFTGSIRYNRIKRFTHYIDKSFKIRFDKNFESKRDPNGDLHQWGFLVGDSKLQCSATDFEFQKQALEKLDNFLLVVSFLSRSRTACLGWSSSDSQAMVSYFRGNYTFPPEKKERSSSRDDIPDRAAFHSILKISMKNFKKYKNKSILKNALYSAIPNDEDTLEMSFLKGFAGIESLVLDYRRKTNLEFALPKEDWTVLKDNIQDFIKKSPTPSLNKTQRAAIYGKLNELNRIPLKEAFDKFCDTYSVNLNDLWPVFTNSRGIGLVEVRNRLIHGIPLPHHVFEAAIIALGNLIITLERMILAVLSCDVKNTTVDPKYLADHTTYLINIDANIEVMTNYVKST
ncbi:MAG: hypothetical protein M0Z90_03670 [Desulfobacteraceae bacterium]|nr:hypothetical protein [Desulfobacteraceae bacterium]